MDILAWFRSDNFESIKNIFELLAYVATLGGLWVIYLTVKSFKKSIEDTQKGEQAQLMEKSMEVLGKFAEEIIPEMNVYGHKCHEKMKEKLKEISDQNVAEGGQELKEFPKKLFPAALLETKLASNGGDLLNKLERVCAYISHDLVIFDVVYPTTHKVLISFFETNRDLISRLTSDDAPYKNLHQVYTRWKAEADKDSLNREQVDLNIRRKKLEEKRANLEQKIK